MVSPVPTNSESDSTINNQDFSSEGVANPPSLSTRSPVSTSADSTTTLREQSAFAPTNLLLETASFSLPGEHWASILSTPCSFAPEYFLQVLDNLLRNPNVTSSCLFRAEIYYDSAADIRSFDDPSSASVNSTLIQSMREADRPRSIEIPAGLKLKRAVVRKLIPRNPGLDKPLVQTVHYLASELEELEEEENVVVQIPHVNGVDEVPFYHPRVQSLAIRYTYTKTEQQGTLSLHYRLFPDTEMTDRMQRTALNLLRIIHKHSNGQKNGYQKRVHLDQLIPQKRFQDTYARLKAKHAKWLMDAWAEVTDPLKHVFEDLGIAAFLIELWRDMYGSKLSLKRKFPGFVDVGCGNGVLVYILLMEGYKGWGFDARRRKSWAVFPESVQQKLKEMILVPDIVLKEYTAEHTNSVLENLGEDGGVHDGKFPSGTFIISNHADQLTPWTPLLAYASQCPFIAIPCCSHALSGKIHRYYDTPPSSRSSGSTDSTRKSIEPSSPSDSSLDEARKATPSPTDSRSPSSSTLTLSPDSAASDSSASRNPHSGSLAMRAKPSQPSAYAGFTAHVMNLASSIGFETVATEMLRIPSTRNLCVVGASPRVQDDDIVRWMDVREVMEREVDDVRKAAQDWVNEALGLRKPGRASGH